jgi:hypothetical protein
VITQHILYLQQNVHGMAGVRALTRQIANEIEVLNPAMDRNGQRLDNCEYPWEDANQAIRSPLDWSFIPDKLLLTRHGRTFLKLVRAAITRLLP